MKIEGSSLSPVGGVQASNRLNQVKKKSTAEVDQVAVSGKAQAYQALLQKTKELPDVREDKVQTLAAQIESGEYQVDGQKVAAKLLSSES